MENAFDQTCIIKGMLRKEEIYEEEPKLLIALNRGLGKIYFDNIDVLVVDRIGKDISGDGMDPIHNRTVYAVPYINEGIPKIQHIAVPGSDMDETHGICKRTGASCETL